jgi:hypothetical protein
LPPGAPPFLRFEWFDALESTGCLTPKKGWAPLYLSVHDDDRLLAVLPAFIKGHSQGEFVFDHGWASFAESRLGIDYYPKLIVAVPFTPATGQRILRAPEADVAQVTEAVAQGVRQLVEHFGISSAHVLFPTQDEATGLAEQGFFRRLGLQYHFRNPGYESFDDFLSCFNAKRRHAIRRERKELAQAGIRLVSRLGGELSSADVDHLFGFYRSTVERYYWGKQYLNRDFFHEVVAKLPSGIHAVLAYEGERDRPIAGAFNLIGDSTLYGRYWGACVERPFLHFNVCYYQGIEDCIARGLRLFEPGAGGEHKLPRGFLPSPTYSNHHLRDPRLELAVRDFVDREARAIEAHCSEVGSPLKT